MQMDFSCWLIYLPNHKSKTSWPCQTKSHGIRGRAILGASGFIHGLGV